VSVATAEFGWLGSARRIFFVLLGGWYTYPSEKYESVGMMKFPTE